MEVSKALGNSMWIVVDPLLFGNSAVFTPQKINMEPGNGGFPVGISFSKGPFSGSMFVLGGVSEHGGNDPMTQTIDPPMISS